MITSWKDKEFKLKMETTRSNYNRGITIKTNNIKK
jgi:hypothetical protein